MIYKVWSMEIEQFSYMEEIITPEGRDLRHRTCQVYGPATLMLVTKRLQEANDEKDVLECTPSPGEWMTFITMEKEGP